ncbi:hypothetical protein J2X65_003378 [Ancylobacter sp. 3268]|uniref:hypothetical protein n=1 Tax=Ancylobacter sp. 3268 TaxID=2817752 RepID=UPI002855A194|nr:hypothetical protein [Ancylobacter sp. 3268]MDR6954011.1 hypothetical protein [Ancylobacter sp. 3268]
MPSRKQFEESERLLRGFDWSKVDAMTDEQIIEAAKADPDSSLPTDAELAEFDLVIPAKSRRKPPKEAAE